MIRKIILHVLITAPVRIRLSWLYQRVGLRG